MKGRGACQAQSVSTTSITNPEYKTRIPLDCGCVLATEVNAFVERNMKISDLQTSRIHF